MGLLAYVQTAAVTLTTTIRGNGMKSPTKWIVGSVLIIFAYMVFEFVSAIYSYANQEPKVVTMSEQVRLLGRCPACHLEKQPPNPCPGLKGWEWEECTDIAHRYPNE